MRRYFEHRTFNIPQQEWAVKGFPSEQYRQKIEANFRPLIARYDLNSWLDSFSDVEMETAYNLLWQLNNNIQKGLGRPTLIQPGCMRYDALIGTARLVVIEAPKDILARQHMAAFDVSGTAGLKFRFFREAQGDSLYEAAYGRYAINPKHPEYQKMAAGSLFDSNTGASQAEEQGFGSKQMHKAFYKSPSEREAAAIAHYQAEQTRKKEKSAFTAQMRSAFGFKDSLSSNYHFNVAGFIIYPLPELDTAGLMKAGINPNELKFKYIEREKSVEAWNFGGCRYGVYYRGLFMGALDVQRAKVFDESLRTEEETVLFTGALQGKYPYFKSSLDDGSAWKLVSSAQTVSGDVDFMSNLLALGFPTISKTGTSAEDVVEYSLYDFLQGSLSQSQVNQAEKNRQSEMRKVVVPEPEEFDFSKVRVDDATKEGVKITAHAAQRMTERGITKKMVQICISKGTKYFDPENGTFNFVLKNGFASGKDLLVGTNTITGKVTTVLRGNNLVKTRFILQ
jgi:hypothetical protein